jgi:hypothetical protein
VDLDRRENPTGTEREIRVLTESGQPYPRTPPAGGVVLTLGSMNGVYSGDDTCLMRYDDSDGYASIIDPAVRYRVTDEPVGKAICSRSIGAGVNDHARDPQSRYGDPGPNRGGCLFQLLVNDAVSAPRR